VTTVSAEWNGSSQQATINRGDYASWKPLLDRVVPG
jgi:hypothetical protein